MIGSHHSALNAANDEVSRLKREVKQLQKWNGDLVAALEPLANFASLIARKYPGWNHDAFPILRAGQYQDEVRLTMKPFRAALAALKDTK